MDTGRNRTGSRPRIAGLGSSAALALDLARRHGLLLADDPDLFVTDRADAGQLEMFAASMARAFVEMGHGPAVLPAAALAAIAGGKGPYIGLLCPGALWLDMARRFCDALEARGAIASDRRLDLEIALHEGVVNAVVHGNLGIGRGPGDDMEGLGAFHREVERRLEDPALASRRVGIEAAWTAEMLTVTVTDEGAGYDSASVPASVPGGGMPVGTVSGRGLGIMRALAESLSVSDGGRRLVLEFSR